MSDPGADADPRLSMRRLDDTERREQAAMVLMPWILLVVALGLALAIDHTSTRRIAFDAGLSLGIVPLLAVAHALRPRGAAVPATDDSHRVLRPLVFAALATVMGAMVVNDPLYGLFTWTGYLQVYLVLRGRWRALGVFVVAMVSASSETGGYPVSGTSSLAVYLSLLIVNAAVAGAVCWFGWSGNEQSRRRAELVEELSEANRRLQETLDENADLHDQLLQRARQDGMVEERRRMAREIHDTLAQGLTGIITQLQAADGAEPGRGRHHIDAAVALARDSLTEARRSVRALRPELLESSQLPEALATVTHQWSVRESTAVELNVTGDARPLGADVEVDLLRCAQEALANVARHARAHRVGLTLSFLDDVVTLDVVDDGTGFDPACRLPERTDGGFGLTAMAQRVAAHAGTLAVESEHGAGTAVSVTIPNAAAAPRPEPVGNRP